MKSKILGLLIALIVLISGCASVNPRNNSPIKNDKGQIEDIKTNQNGVMAEVGKLQQENELLNSRLEEVQQGLANINAAISRNDNSGIQILQGDGALIMVFSLTVIGMLLFWYRDKAIKSEKAAKIMASQVAKFNDPVLNDSILLEALSQNCEKRIFEMLTKQY